MKNTTKKQHYIMILDWMADKYKLKGNELLAYALIYGFSQDGESEYKGGFSYLSRWLGADRATIIRVLKRLESKGLLTKRQELVAGQMVNRYVAEVPEEVQKTVEIKDDAPENPAESHPPDQWKNATSRKMPLVAKCDVGQWQNATGGSGKTPPSNTTGYTTGYTTPSCARGAQGGEPTPKDVFAKYAGTDKPLLEALTRFNAYRASRRGKVWDAQSAQAVCDKLTQLADESKTTKRTEYMIASIQQSIEAGWSVLDHPKSWGHAAGQRAKPSSLRVERSPDEIAASGDWMRTALLRRPLIRQQKAGAGSD